MEVRAKFEKQKQKKNAALSYCAHKISGHIDRDLLTPNFRDLLIWVI